MMLIIKHLLINKLVFLGFRLQLRLRLLLRTAIILCTKFQSKELHTHIYIVYIISCIKSRYIYVCNKFKFCFILFDFSSNNTQISVSTASEIFCDFHVFFAEVREKSESSKTARREYNESGRGSVRTGYAKMMTIHGNCDKFLYGQHHLFSVGNSGSVQFA